MSSLAHRSVRFYTNRKKVVPASLLVTLGERVCIVCGCTDSRACPGGCFWRVIHKGTNTGVCSGCYHDRGPQ
jgi:hypothetical protein